MHILIIGAAGMVGGKLDRAAAQGRRARRQGDHRAHPRRRRRAGASRHGAGFGHDGGGRPRPRPASAERSSRRGPTSSSISRRSSRARPRPISTRATASISTARAILFEAIRKVGDGYRPRVVFTSSIAVFGAPFPERDRRRVLPDAADQLRHAEGDRRAAALRLHAARLLRRHRHPAADDLRPAGQAQQGRVGLLLQHHPRAAGRPGGGAAGGRDVRHWHASPRSAVGFLVHAADDRRRRRRRAPQPDHARASSATVGEQIEALRQVAGDKAVDAASAASPTRRS